MTADKLIAFENVRVVRDYISINAYAPDFTSLSFLKNLRTIKGQSLTRAYVSRLWSIAVSVVK